MSLNTIIAAKNVTKAFGDTQALRSVSLDVVAGEILAIMGPSGSGKSTLLHSLAAITQIDHGTILLGDQRIDGLSDSKRSILRRTTFGFVFQFSQLVPELTAHDNVALPLLLNNVPRAQAYKQALEWLDKVGLKNKTHSLSGQLSGGEAQRVAIARAMVITPKVIFADEPTGSLDSLNSQRIMELFIATAKENNTTVVMVTHEPSIAAYADREIVMRDGKIVGHK